MAIALSVRPAVAADVAAITEVFLASRAAAMPYLPRLHTDAQTLAYFSSVVLPECATWVACQGTGEVVGFAALCGDELEHLYVRPDMLGRLIGSGLLDEVAVASPRGVRLHVFQRNGRARGFYERRGFRLVSTEDGSGNEEGEPDAVYVRP